MKLIINDGNINDGNKSQSLTALLTEVANLKQLGSPI